MEQYESESGDLKAVGCCGSVVRANANDWGLILGGGAGIHK